MRCDFNPRPPYGEGPARGRVITRAAVFQSTPPVWGATVAYEAPYAAYVISIHAPRMGSDLG